MAWASLKDTIHQHGIGELHMYPGPHGLGLIEGLWRVSVSDIVLYRVSRAAWPGPH